MTCQSTGVSSNQPASSNSISSVQPAFRCRSGGVSGQLNRRNQPAFKPYASDRPALRKSAGSTCHISLLPPRRRLRLLCFARISPVSSRRRAPYLLIPRRRSITPPRIHSPSLTPSLAWTPPAQAAATVFSPQRRLHAHLRRPCTTAANAAGAARATRAPPPPSTSAPHHYHALSAIHAAAAPRRSRTRSVFSPSAR